MQHSNITLYSLRAHSLQQVHNAAPTPSDIKGYHTYEGVTQLQKKNSEMQLSQRRAIQDLLQRVMRYWAIY